MASNLISIGLWWWLPGQLTVWLQDGYYRVTTRAGDPFPERGSPRWRRHYRAIFTLVIVAYLCYTVYEADWQMQRNPDLYQLLGVGRDISTEGVKSAMRRFSVKYHPDKVPESQRETASQTFVILRQAADVLSDPVKRFAYDRLGPVVFDMQQKAGGNPLKSYGDWVERAIVDRVGPQYVGSLIFLLFLGYMRVLPQGRYWRWMLFLGNAWFEVQIITRPTWPSLLTKVVNPALKVFSLGRHEPLLPFQLLKLLHTLSISANIAINQLGPYYRTIPVSDPGHTQHLMQEQMRGLQHMASETARLLGLELTPFREENSSTTEGQSRIKEQVRRWLVLNEIRKDPSYTAAVQRVIERRRGGLDESVGTLDESGEMVEDEDRKAR